METYKVKYYDVHEACDLNFCSCLICVKHKETVTPQIKTNKQITKKEKLQQKRLR